jgi:hypothetical protein
MQQVIAACMEIALASRNVKPDSWMAMHAPSCAADAWRAAKV